MMSQKQVKKECQKFPSLDRNGRPGYSRNKTRVVAMECKGIIDWRTRIESPRSWGFESQGFKR
jgi:hypothetical protein